MTTPRASEAEALREVPATGHLLLDPQRVVMEGIYVRQLPEAGELEQLTRSIVAGGEVREAIGVREDGPAGELRYVLVYGMRRWLASRAAGLGAIPVRNHGRIPASESIALQVAENEVRIDAHPVDTAVGYHLLVREGGMSQAEVARVARRSAAHVSYMRAAGEAILMLREEERTALCRAPGATVPRFQRIAPLRSVAERVSALRALLTEAEAQEPCVPVRSAPSFGAGRTRDGDAWSMHLRYHDEELRRDPEAAARVLRFLEEQVQRVRRQQAAGQRQAPRRLRRAVTWEIL